MEYILQDPYIMTDKRFEPDLAVMREEVHELDHLATHLERTETVALERATTEHLMDLEAWKRQLEAFKAVSAKRIQAYLRGRRTRARIAKLRTAAFCMSFMEYEVRGGVEPLELTEDGEVDLRHSKFWKPHFMWICDIKEKAGEAANDFMFLADITPSGEIVNKAPKRAGRCIFNRCMYDLQEFIPVAHTDGMLEFDLSSLLSL